MRAIVPGHAGARNCKFLEKVSVTDIACKVSKANSQQLTLPVAIVCVYVLKAKGLVLNAVFQKCWIILNLLIV